MIGPEPGFRVLVDALTSLDINYMVAGSLATSIHGIPRSTNDIDLVVDMKEGQADPLVAELKTEFYIDPPEAIRGALRACRMFNLIHFATSYKFDLYPLLHRPYDQAAFARRKLQAYAFEGEEALKFCVASAEDAVLSKLVWYRAGKEVSERQWNDVLDVVRVQRDLLDLAYLRQWAGSLGVEDLLEEAVAGQG